MTEPGSTTTIYTIGHSNHGIREFIDLLRMHSIQTVADVRSTPFSGYNRHFNQGALKNSLWEARIEYDYLGKELGGHPSLNELYDGGHVVYERLATEPEFRRAIRRIANLAGTTRLVIMCAEGDPAKCHRHPLLARALLERELRVYRIRRDGTLSDAAAMFAQPVDPQLPLFEPPGEDLSWRSPKRIR